MSTSTYPLGEVLGLSRLRERVPAQAATTPSTPARRVRVQLTEPSRPQRRKLFPQQARILKFQNRWERIKEDLPPQLSRKHIGMISIGGVIGTGLFLGSADALRHGGPVGAFLGYLIIGTIVYCLCVSIGEMIGYLPNVGGVVGLADLYVDPALGFSLGWAAWYNWAITLPAEVSAAVVAIQFWIPPEQELPRHIAAAISAGYLAVAIIINCFPSRVYGEMEFYLSCFKALTIVFIIICCLLIDFGASHQGPIGFRYWKAMPFNSYLDIKGVKGNFLGFWAVLMQASFSFFGSECAGIAAGEVMEAAGEVIDATRNVPRALRKVWIRITLFYLGGVLASGLVVKACTPDLSRDDGTGRSSPFVIAFSLAGWAVMPHLVNIAILISAWSAAASDIYISSRFLFFLARRRHAPTFLAHLFRYPRARGVRGRSRDDDTDGSRSENSDDEGSVADSDTDTDSHSDESAGLPTNELLGGQRITQSHTYVMPLASVLVSSSVGLLTFLSLSKTSTGGANTVFSWLVSVASVASLQSWIAMLFTYIRWYQGTVHYEQKFKASDSSEEAETAREQIAKIKKHRQWGQPYLAYYAITLCTIILLTNGWAVFVHQKWSIAEVLNQSQSDMSTQDGNQESLPNHISLFLSSYVPLPFFVLLTFGYKLIKQTKMISVEEMMFYQGRLPVQVAHEEEKPQGVLERLLTWLTVI